MPDTPSKTKVFWNEHEKSLLCAEAARLLFELRCSRKLDALLQAQVSVLDASRHRKLLALTGMEWYTAGVNRELELLKAQRDNAASPAAAATAPAPATRPASELPLGELYPAIRARLVSELASFVSDVLAEVRWPAELSALATSSTLGDTLLQSLVQSPSAAKASAEQRPPVTRPPSVLVVGLKGGQMEEVRRDIGKDLDLRFFGSDENKEKLRAMCEQTDYTVAMVGFISHTHEEIMVRRGRNYIRCNGGITRLKETLRHLLQDRLVSA